MNSTVSALQAGKASLLVSGDILRDPKVMLALKERATLTPMALSGHPVAPVTGMSDSGLARALAAGKDGVIVVVEPGPSDKSGIEKLAKMLGGVKNTPQIVVVGRSFNALQWNFQFRGVRVSHEKSRGRSFLTSLPAVELESAPKVEVVKPKKAKKADLTPKFTFVGRDEEMAAMAELLTAGGPIVVSGPRGVGRRSLVEAAIAASDLTRLPDLAFRRAVGFDTLVARLAEITKAGGSTKLVDALKSKAKPLDLIQAALEALAEADGTASQVLVLDELEWVAGREGDFFRKSRLELLVRALLQGSFPLRMIFLSTVQPVFYAEGAAANLRRVELEGLKGRFFNDLFEGMKVADFPRDKFGPLSERVFGNGLAVRLCAAAVLKNGPKAIDDAKFLKMDKASDESVLRRYITRRLEKLPKDMSSALASIAHFMDPLTSEELTKLGINRKDRSALLSSGLLDQVGTLESKGFRVHPLVRLSFRARDVSNFDDFDSVAEMRRGQAEKASGVAKLAKLQEANRAMVRSRKTRNLARLDYPDNDALVDSVIGLMRAKQPRLDMAAARLAEALKKNPADSDAHLLKIDLLRSQNREKDSKVSREDVQAAIDAAIEAAPVPEVYHQAVSFALATRRRGDAVKIMQAAVELMPSESRLRTRLAALLSRQGQRDAAEEQLKAAMDLEPMLPDAYGLLGQLRKDSGVEHLEEAEQLLREAVRLAPGDLVQTGRLIWLLVDKARMADDGAALYAEAKALAEVLLQDHKDTWEVYLLLTTICREMGDASKAVWFLKQARKHLPKRRDVKTRVELESALIDVAGGKTRNAVKKIRGIAKHEPSNARVFGALGTALAADGQLVAAHAEFMRARERTGKNSLERKAYEKALETVKAQIAAEHAAAAAAPEAETSEVQEAVTEVANAVSDAVDAAAEAADAVGDAAEAVVDAAADAVKAAAETVVETVGNAVADAMDAVAEAVEKVVGSDDDASDEEPKSE